MILDENWSRGIIKKSGFFSSTKPLQDSHQTTPRKKNIYIKLFSQARYKPDTPPNPFVCCENNHTLTSLFKAHRRAWERSKGTTVMWVSSGQHHFPWLKQAKVPRTPWAHSLAADVPSLTTCCFSQKNLSQLPQGFGVWGHHAGMSRRITIV